MDTDDIQRREWVEGLLAEVPVVTWDRFLLEEDDERGQCVRAYGWIDREDDDYKDFVVARIFPEENLIGYVTSSDEYTDHLHEQWFGEVDDHDPCHRVEEHFELDNCVELERSSDAEERSSRSPR